MVSDTSKSIPVRGRPRDTSKREALLNAARALFLDQGVEAVTMDAVISKAGIARATLYANFPDKESLLVEVILRESRFIVADDYVHAAHQQSLESTLTQFGVGLLGFLSNAEMIGFERLIYAATQKHPDLAYRFFEAGPGRARRILQRVIVSAAHAGEIAVDDADSATDDLIGLLQGFVRVELTFSSRPPLKPDEIQKRAERATRMFLKLYRVL